MFNCITDDVISYCVHGCGNQEVIDRYHLESAREYLANLCRDMDKENLAREEGNDRSL